MSARIGGARIGLLVLEALPNARAVRRLIADHAPRIAFVGLSNPQRPGAGGLVGQVRRHLARSGPGLLPYLAVNFGLPDLLGPLAPLARPLTRPFARGPAGPEATPLPRLCRDLGLPCLPIDDVNGPETEAALRAHAPDLLVTFHFDQILSAGTHALADGDGAFGVSVHRLVPAIDAGAILAQEAVGLPAGVTATRAAIDLHERGRVLLEGVLDTLDREGRLPEGRTPPSLPYRGFPDRALLARLARAGARLTDAADLRAALSLSA